MKRPPLVIAGLVVLLGLGAWWLFGRTSPSSSDKASAPDTPSAQSPSQFRPVDPTKPARGPISVEGKVTVAPEVTQGLVDFSRKPWTTVPLRTEERDRARAMMRSVASRAIDLAKASARKSKSFKRTSYTQDVGADAPMHLGDRWGKDGRPAGEMAAATPTASPMRVIFREGDDGSTFNLLKTKEHTAVGGGMDSSVATQQVQRFFVENGLLSETANDKIEGMEVRERHVSAQQGGGADDQDLLAQQDVLLRRTYDGKQVINSHASVGILPETNEVVQVQLEHWTPVDTGGTETTKAEQPEGEARRTAESLQDKLLKQIEAEADEPIASASVEHVEEAWFQTDTGLIPVLVFVVRVFYAADPKEPRNLIVAINPNGDDSLIWDQGRIVRDPVPPTDPG